MQNLSWHTFESAHVVIIPETRVAGTMMWAVPPILVPWKLFLDTSLPVASIYEEELREVYFFCGLAFRGYYRRFEPHLI